MSEPAYRVLALARTKTGVRVVAAEGRGDISFVRPPELLPNGVRVFGIHGPVTLRCSAELALAAMGPPPVPVELATKRRSPTPRPISPGVARYREEQRAIARTKAMRAIQLLQDGLAPTIIEACEAAGMSESGLAIIRRREPVVADRWAEYVASVSRRHGRRA